MALRELRDAGNTAIGQVESVTCPVRCVTWPLRLWKETKRLLGQGKLNPVVMSFYAEPSWSSCDVGWYRLTSLDNLRILSPTAGRVMRSYFCAKEAEGGRGVTSHLSWAERFVQESTLTSTTICQGSFSTNPKTAGAITLTVRHETSGCVGYFEFLLCLQCLQSSKI